MTALCPSMHRTPTGKRIPFYTNNVHRRPDLRMDYYRTERIMALSWQILNTVTFFSVARRGKKCGIRTQFNAYRDMNTKFYRGMEESDSLRNSRPVKEVWAVFPERNTSPRR